jgi:hypothetical protein
MSGKWILATVLNYNETQKYIAPKLIAGCLSGFIEVSFPIQANPGMTFNVESKILSGSAHLLILLVEVFDNLIEIWFFSQACMRAGKIKDADIGTLIVEIS